MSDLGTTKITVSNTVCFVGIHKFHPIYPQAKPLEATMIPRPDDYDTFPTNDAGEPLMTVEGYYYEQYLDDEPEYDDQYADAYEENPNDYI